MIDIKIDLVPFGVEEHKREIGHIIIANDGSGDSMTGSYNVHFHDGMDIRVEGHHRRNDVYDLLLLALQERWDKKNGNKDVDNH